MQQIKAVFASGEFTFLQTKSANLCKIILAPTLVNLFTDLFCKSIKFVGKFLIKMARETKF